MPEETLAVPQEPEAKSAPLPQTTVSILSGLM